MWQTKTRTVCRAADNMADNYNRPSAVAPYTHRAQISTLTTINAVRPNGWFADFAHNCSACQANHYCLACPRHGILDIGHYRMLPFFR